jgi:hypothetical protein
LLPLLRTWSNLPGFEQLKLWRKFMCKALSWLVA